VTRDRLLAALDQDHSAKRGLVLDRQHLVRARRPAAGVAVGDEVLHKA
jgi:hypothetical protein